MSLRRPRVKWLLILIALLAACAAAVHAPDRDAPALNPDKPHHTAQGFRNNYLAALGNGGGNFWKWQWERRWAGLPKPPANGYTSPFPLVKPDVAWLKANRRETTATWIGHATVLMQVAGVNILTDPHLTERASPVSFAGPKRLVPPALSFEELPHIDMVVISHNHYDHLDQGTVVRLAQQPGGSPRFFVPLGNRAWFRQLGIDDVVEMDWWDKQTFKGLEVTLTPVQHWSARGFADRFATLWGGWHVRSGAAAGAMQAAHTVARPANASVEPVSAATQPASARAQPASAIARPFSFFFAGDTGYSKDFPDIAQRLGAVDFAILPIGAYEPRWFMASQHVDPAEAVKIHRDLKARQSLGMHWGTFELTDEPLDEPPRARARALQAAGVEAARFAVLKHGEMMRPQ